MTCLICCFFPIQPTNFLRRPIQVATEKISQLMRGKNCPDFYCHFRSVCTPGIQFDHFPKALFSQVSINISIVEFHIQGYKISQLFIYMKIALFRLVCKQGIQFDHFQKALFSQVSISISIVEFQTQGYKISQPFIYLTISQICIAISVWFVHNPVRPFPKGSIFTSQQLLAHN